MAEPVQPQGFEGVSSTARPCLGAWLTMTALTTSVRPRQRAVACTHFPAEGRRALLLGAEGCTGS